MRRRLSPPRSPRRFAVIGLTGSIAMGKSTTAAMLRRLGLRLFDADAAVHALMADRGAAVRPIATRFPGMDVSHGIDRKALGRLVFSDGAALVALEDIIHPMVQILRNQFLRQAGLARVKAVVLDTPLLFETGGDRFCSAVMVVSAPAFLQRQRALARPDMTPGRLDAILARQMGDWEKRRRSQAVVPTGLGKRESLNRIRRFLTLLTRSRDRVL